MATTRVFLTLKMLAALSPHHFSNSANTNKLKKSHAILVLFAVWSTLSHDVSLAQTAGAYISIKNVSPVWFILNIQKHMNHKK